MDKDNKKNNGKKSDKKLHISDVINSNLVDGKLDAVGALTDIFNEECAKAVLKTIIEQKGGDSSVVD
jgi:hypothetical protein